MRPGTKTRLLVYRNIKGILTERRRCIQLLVGCGYTTGIKRWVSSLG